MIDTCNKCLDGKNKYEDTQVLNYYLMTSEDDQKYNKAMSDSQFWAMTLPVFVRAGLYTDLWKPDDIKQSGTQMEYFQKLQMKLRKKQVRYSHVSAQIKAFYEKEKEEENKKIKIILD